MTAAAEPSKPCSRCGETQPLTEYWRAGAKHDGRIAVCRGCKLATSRNGAKQSPFDAADELWRDHAACAGHPTDTFFPPPPAKPIGRGPDRRYDEARRICALCPVRRQCLDYARRHGFGGGMWGGQIK